MILVLICGLLTVIALMLLIIGSMVNNILNMVAEIYGALLVQDKFEHTEGKF